MLRRCSQLFFLLVNPLLPLCGQTEKGQGNISPWPFGFCCVVWGFSLRGSTGIVPVEPPI